jgi:integrase
MLRTALNLGRKCTPAKVVTIPYFPMVAETQARQGFLTDEQYKKLRDALPEYLKPLFVAAYFTGVRLGELLAIRWEQVDLEQGFITHSAADTKTGHSRAVPILDGDMKILAGVVSRPRGQLSFSISQRRYSFPRISFVMEKHLCDGGCSGVEVP